MEAFVLIFGIVVLFLNGVLAVTGHPFNIFATAFLGTCLGLYFLS